MKLQWIAQAEQEMQRFGRLLAEQLRSGDVVALIGDLGTGKTALTKAVAAGLGVSEMITSPTFTILCEYHSGRLPLYHFDVYRTGNPDELFEIGFEEYLFGDGVCIVEWADLVPDLMPSNCIFVRIAYGQEESQRKYELMLPQDRAWSFDELQPQEK